MPIVRRSRPPKDVAPEVWPEPDEASVLALRNLIVKNPYFADVVEQLFPNFNWEPGETMAVKGLASEIGISPRLLSKFLDDMASIGAGLPSYRRPHTDDKAPYDGFTWHVDFDKMIRRAVA